MVVGDTIESGLRAGLARRAFLLSGAASAAAGLTCHAVPAQGYLPDGATLDAFLDVLLPGDQDTPSASILGVGSSFLQEVEPASMTERLVSAGTGFLDTVGPVRFPDLPPLAQQEISHWMASSDYDAIPGRFYHVVRLFAVAYYYSHPEVVSGLPLNPAPQPMGYLPPWNDR